MITLVRDWWRTLARKERVMIAVGGAVLSVALLYALTFEPAWVARNRVSRELPSLHSQLAELKALREETQILREHGRGSGGIEALKVAAEQSLARQGMKGSVRAEGQQTIVVSVDGVPAGVWFTWLEGFAREARVRITQARVIRTAAPGSVSAEVALRVPAG